MSRETELVLVSEFIGAIMFDLGSVEVTPTAANYIAKALSGKKGGKVVSLIARHAEYSTTQPIFYVIARRKAGDFSVESWLLPLLNEQLLPDLKDLLKRSGLEEPHDITASYVVVIPTTKFLHTSELEEKPKFDVYEPTFQEVRFKVRKALGELG